MNAKVQKTIHGLSVVAHPVFKGEPTPAYWLGAINEHALEPRFPSAPEVFQFVARQRAGTSRV
jgi:hypothetical protein